MNKNKMKCYNCDKKNHFVKKCRVSKKIDFDKFDSKKNQNSINIIVILQIKTSRNEAVTHFFCQVTFFINDKLIYIKIMMNNDVTFNFISQLKMKELNIINIEKILKKLKILNNILLRVYQAHIFKIKIIDETNQQRIDDETLLKIDMIEINMILKMS